MRLDQVARHHGTGGSRVDALRGISHVFAAGTFTAVMGPSGSGKSTLLQCAAGLDRPDAGSVWIGGLEITRISETMRTALRRDRIGFVFQAYNLLPALTAADNVALPLRLAGRRPDRRSVREALARVGLTDQAGRRPGQLSGGQQQRVALARALLTRPEVLFADEPTGALDRSTGRLVLELLRRSVDEEGLTIVMVTHDPVAAAYADEVLFLADGALVGRLDASTPDRIAAAMNHLEPA
ncbi:ABC transporter ATP-binding protein [Nocardioides daejeonensis]|uniref:ABC transporter ATP-binding protein n=1 Tax=Nocardioides daejeonensis TaxID=1046556 RepID=UPI001EF509CD|nr:ABC transporter ATP-binding protein [Nocardioides daejeonensis]